LGEHHCSDWGGLNGIEAKASSFLELEVVNGTRRRLFGEDNVETSEI
jgi:hypothetical protein